jgi:hypothetical protein
MQEQIEFQPSSHIRGEALQLKRGPIRSQVFHIHVKIPPRGSGKGLQNDDLTLS